jgi:hypothetical protein
VVGRFRPSLDLPDAAGGLPGIRLVAITPTSHGMLADTYELVHLPTQATLSITQQERHRDPAVPNEAAIAQVMRNFNRYTADVPLLPVEEDLLAGWPTMSPDAERLFAGMVARLNLTHPKRLWGIGLRYWDPCRRELGRPALSDLKGDGRRLWGEGDYWELTWDSYPFIGDLVSAVTDPLVGIAGAHVEWEEGDRRAVVTCGTARLRLTHNPRFRDPSMVLARPPRRRLPS